VCVCVCVCVCVVGRIKGILTKTVILGTGFLHENG